jgi:hypothetical protein
MKSIFVVTLLSLFLFSGCGGGGGGGSITPVDNTNLNNDVVLIDDVPKAVLNFNYSKPDCNTTTVECQTEHLNILKNQTLSFYELDGYTPYLGEIIFENNLTNESNLLSDIRIDGKFKEGYSEYNISCYYYSKAKDDLNLTSNFTYLCETFGDYDKYYLFNIDEIDNTISGNNIYKQLINSTIKDDLIDLESASCCTDVIFSSGYISDKYDLWDYFVSKANITKKWDTYEYNTQGIVTGTKFNDITSTETIQSASLVKTTNSAYGTGSGEYLNFERFSDHIKISFGSTNYYYKRYVKIGDYIDANKKFKVDSHNYLRTLKTGYDYQDVLQISDANTAEYLQKDKGSVGRLVFSKSATYPYSILGWDLELVNNLP